MNIKVERCTRSFRLTFPDGSREIISNPESEWWNREAARKALNIAEHVYHLKRRNVRFIVVN